MYPLFNLSTNGTMENTITDTVAHICAANKGNSDILIHADAVIRYRDHLGDIRQWGEKQMCFDEVASLLRTGVEAEKKTMVNEMLKRGGQFDDTVTIDNMRFRANAFLHSGDRKLGIVLRRTRDDIPSFDELGLDFQLQDWLNNRTGLILVTGPTGSGKTATLAAMVDYLNSHYAGHTILLEDPIEYVHTHKKGFLTQREVGRDVTSFSQGLRASLRQNPNYIVVCEMRDRETMETALQAAETGHLVLGTLHTSSALHTPTRILDFFPEDVRPLIRSQLATSLRGILAQILVPRADASGKVLMTEALSNYPDVQNIIRKGEFLQLSNVLKNPGQRLNTWLLNDKLAQAVEGGKITLEAGMQATYNRAELEQLLQFGSAG
jgi:twitching motility protein PilT